MNGVDNDKGNGFYTSFETKKTQDVFVCASDLSPLVFLMAILFSINLSML